MRPDATADMNRNRTGSDELFINTVVNLGRE